MRLRVHRFLDKGLKFGCQVFDMFLNVSGGLGRMLFLFHDI